MNAGGMGDRRGVVDKTVRRGGGGWILRFLGILLVGSAVLAISTGACRKRKTPSSPVATADGAAVAEATATAEGAGIQGRPGATTEPEADWMTLDDQEVARRSGITAAECAMALAEGEGVRITVCDFIRQVNAMPPRYRSRFDSIERRREFLDDMIAAAVLEVEARRLGLDRTPEAEVAIERILAERMEAEIRAELRAEIRAGITAADEQAYYDAHPDEFSRPELASAAQIVVETEEAAREIIAMLRAPDAEPGLFAKLALERSLDEETKTRGGKLAFFTRPDVRSDLYQSVHPAIATAVFSMRDVGEIYPDPIRTEQGFHVLQLVGKRAAIARTIDQVRPMIRSRIEEQRLREAWDRRLDEIKREVGVEEYPENLLHVRPDLPTPDEMRSAHDHRHGPDVDLQVPAASPPAQALPEGAEP